MPRRKIYKIKDIHAREILDSRGNPTVEAEVILDSGDKFKASVPSGASTGAYEAIELRDGNKKRYGGLGVKKACANVKKISRALKGVDILKQKEIDKKMIKLDGTKNKSKLGANAILAVSLVCARAGAFASELELYEYINKIYFHGIPHPAFCGVRDDICKTPTPMFNIFNGGKHADTNLDIQEIMVVPLIKKSIKEKVRIGTEIFQTLGKILKVNKLDTDLGNEGGYAPRVKKTEDALNFVCQAIKKAGYQLGKEVALALDVGASELYDQKKKKYIFKLEKWQLSNQELVVKYKKWLAKYPIFSLEDGLAEDDWVGWKIIGKEMSSAKSKFWSEILLVADDLVTTNLKRLKLAVKNKVANAVIVKPNQIGTLTETIEFVKYARQKKYALVVSHRSGETEDDIIADLALAVAADFVKFGAPSRGERIVKYNRLMEIEEK